MQDLTAGQLMEILRLVDELVMSIAIITKAVVPQLKPKREQGGPL